MKNKVGTKSAPTEEQILRGMKNVHPHRFDIKCKCFQCKNSAYTVGVLHCESCGSPVPHTNLAACPNHKICNGGTFSKDMVGTKRDPGPGVHKHSEKCYYFRTEKTSHERFFKLVTCQELFRY